MDKPSLAYISQYDFTDVSKWSGLTYYIARALEPYFKITYISPLKVRNKAFYRLKRKYYQTLKGQNYWFDREPNVSMGYAKQVENKLKHCNVDVVFSPGTIPVSMVETKKPVVIYTDSSFSGLLDFYPRYTNLNKKTITNGNKLEQNALNKCGLAIYSSEWAAKSVLDVYDIDRSKINIVPFGANIDTDNELSEIGPLIENRSKTKCRLIFIGVDWYRKGANLAVEVTRQLNTSGIPTELHIVGCNPPKGIALENYIITHGFINKSNPFEKIRLYKLLAESHFLIVPSQAEAFGLVFCEANAFGVPSISYQVGGIPTVIKNNINGICFKKETNISDFVSFIQKFFTNNEKYNELAYSSFNEYKKRLNWNVAGKKLDSLIKEMLLSL